MEFTVQGVGGELFMASKTSYSTGLWASSTFSLFVGLWHVLRESLLRESSAAGFMLPESRNERTMAFIQVPVCA